MGATCPLVLVAATAAKLRDVCRSTASKPEPLMTFGACS